MAFTTDQYIRLNNAPILIDADADLHAFLETWFEPEMLHEIFHERKEPINDKSRVEGSAYDNDYLPKLPDLRINQFQFPTGFSRYSRGLFLVDKISLAKIGWNAWNQNAPAGTNTPTFAELRNQFPSLLQDVIQPPDQSNPPIDTWTTEEINYGYKNNPVFLSINAENFIRFEVYCLKPIRVPYRSRDVWLLPVVDWRYFLQYTKDLDFKAIVHHSNHMTWEELFNAFFNFEFFGNPNNSWVDPTQRARTRYPRDAAINEALGVPDHSVRNMRKNVSVTLDAAAFSIGYRYVPLWGCMDYQVSKSLRKFQITPGRFGMGDLVISGGLSGKCQEPKFIQVTARKARDWFNGYDWWRESKTENLGNSTIKPDKDFDAENAYPDIFEYVHLVNPESGNRPFGKGFYISSLWNVNVPTSTGSSEDTRAKFQAFVQQWSNDWIKWVAADYLDITYAGIPKTMEACQDPNKSPDENLELATFLTGFDNWAIIDLGFGPYGQNKITTRIQSLPQMWFPKFLINQDKEDMTHYGPAFFIADECVPRARKQGNTFKLGKKRAYFMVLAPEDNASPEWILKRTEVYADVHNTLTSLQAQHSVPMQCKFINGIWCVDVAECC